MTSRPDVRSANELRGLKFGLSRAEFHETLLPTVLYIGLELDITDYVGFPLLERLCGPNNSYIEQLESRCPEATFSLQGAGSPFASTQSEPLHILIVTEKLSVLQQATVLVSDITQRIRTEFDQYNSKILEQLTRLGKRYGTSHLLQLLPPQYLELYSLETLINNPTETENKIDNVAIITPKIIQQVPNYQKYEQFITNQAKIYTGQYLQDKEYHENTNTIVTTIQDTRQKLQSVKYQNNQSKTLDLNLLEYIYNLDYTIPIYSSLIGNYIQTLDQVYEKHILQKNIDNKSISLGNKTTDISNTTTSTNKDDKLSHDDKKSEIISDTIDPNQGNNDTIDNDDNDDDYESFEMFLQDDADDNKLIAEKDADTKVNTEKGSDVGESNTSSYTVQSVINDADSYNELLEDLQKVESARSRALNKLNTSNILNYNLQKGSSAKTTTDKIQSKLFQKLVGKAIAEKENKAKDTTSVQLEEKLYVPVVASTLNTTHVQTDVPTDVARFSKNQQFDNNYYNSTVNKNQYQQQNLVDHYSAPFQQQQSHHPRHQQDYNSSYNQQSYGNTPYHNSNSQPPQQQNRYHSYNSYNKRY